MTCKKCENLEFHMEEHYPFVVAYYCDKIKSIISYPENCICDLFEEKLADINLKELYNFRRVK